MSNEKAPPLIQCLHENGEAIGMAATIKQQAEIIRLQAVEIERMKQMVTSSDYNADCDAVTDWRAKCDPKLMATAQSPAAIQYALADAKSDIATLARERDALAAENQRLREALEKISAYAPCSGIKDPGFTKMHMGILARAALSSNKEQSK